jgi:Amino acid synthesis
MDIRKIVTVVEETRIEMGKSIDPPTRKAAVAAVITNPFAGTYKEDLEELMNVGEELGGMLGGMAVKALGIAPENAHSYGKAAIVGSNGELEHAAAILHPKLGKPFRDALAGGKSIIPSAKKMGRPGTEIDVPIHYKDAAFVRTHFDAMAVRVQDAPRGNEIVVVLVVSDSGRPLARVGGLTVNEAKKEDGLR